MKKKIRKLLSKANAVFVGSLIVCLIVFGFTVKANNDTINVLDGGVLNLINQSEAGNLGYDVALTNDSDVDATFAGDLSVTGNTALTGTLAVTGATTLTGGLAGSLTVATNITQTDGVFSVTDDIASPTASTNLGILSVTCSGVGLENGGCADGTTGYLRFQQEIPGNNTTGISTNTAIIAVVLDDSASTSIETSLQFQQILDNGTMPTTVFELDSGVGIFSYAVNIAGALTGTASSTFVNGIKGQYYSVDNTAGLTSTCTASTTNGVLLTVKNGLITACN